MSSAMHDEAEEQSRCLDDAVPDGQRELQATPEKAWERMRKPLTNPREGCFVVEKGEGGLEECDSGQKTTAHKVRKHCVLIEFDS